MKLNVERVYVRYITRERIAHKAVANERREGTCARERKRERERNSTPPLKLEVYS